MHRLQLIFFIYFQYYQIKRIYEHFNHIHNRWQMCLMSNFTDRILLQMKWKPMENKSFRDNIISGRTLFTKFFYSLKSVFLYCLFLMSQKYISIFNFVIFLFA